jgi:FAD synthetase
MKRIIAFGAFDPLHDGHRDFFRQARALGDHLIVIVARDSSIQKRKGRIPFQSETARLTAVQQEPLVSEARLGNEGTSPFEILSQLEFEVVALGYDQQPPEEVIRRELDARGKQSVTVVRLQPFAPEQFKSTLLRGEAT